MKIGCGAMKIPVTVQDMTITLHLREAWSTSSQVLQYLTRYRKHEWSSCLEESRNALEMMQRMQTVVAITELNLRLHVSCQRPYYSTYI